MRSQAGVENVLVVLCWCSTPLRREVLHFERSLGADESTFITTSAILASARDRIDFMTRSPTYRWTSLALDSPRVSETTLPATAPVDSGPTSAQSLSALPWIPSKRPAGVHHGLRLSTPRAFISLQNRLTSSPPADRLPSTKALPSRPPPSAELTQVPPATGRRCPSSDSTPTRRRRSVSCRTPHQS